MIFLKIYTSGHISEISIPIFMKYLCNESCQSLCRQKNNAVEQIQLQVIETNQGFQIYIIYTMGATQRLCYNVGEYGDLNIGREIVHKKKKHNSSFTRFLNKTIVFVLSVLIKKKPEEEI